MFQVVKEARFPEDYSKTLNSTDGATAVRAFARQTAQAATSEAAKDGVAVSRLKKWDRTRG